MNFRGQIERRTQGCSAKRPRQAAFFVRKHTGGLRHYDDILVERNAPTRRLWYTRLQIQTITRPHVAGVILVLPARRVWEEFDRDLKNANYIYGRPTGNYLSPRGSLSHQDFCNLFCSAFSAANQQKSSYFVLVKMSKSTGTLFFSRVGVCVTTLQSMKNPNFRVIITLLSNNDPRGEQIVASETVIVMDSGF